MHGHHLESDWYVCACGCVCGWLAGAEVACRGNNRNPYYGYVSFDNFGVAAFNIFCVITLDNWTPNQLYVLWDAMGPGAPIAFFLLLVIFGTYFGLQLFVAIMSSKFAQIASAVSTSIQIIPACSICIP